MKEPEAAIRSGLLAHKDLGSARKAAAAVGMPAVCVRLEVAAEAGKAGSAPRLQGAPNRLAFSPCRHGSLRIARRVHGSTRSCPAEQHSTRYWGKNNPVYGVVRKNTVIVENKTEAALIPPINLG